MSSLSNPKQLGHHRWPVQTSRFGNKLNNQGVPYVSSFDLAGAQELGTKAYSANTLQE